VVVPTTAGTGSDSSPDAGIHPDPHSVSAGITSRHVVPRLALCDPELTLTLPPRLTAATGLDAISHCIEGYLAKGDNPLADVLALDGLSRAWRWVEKATADGGDVEARAQMMLAAFEGGIAIGKGLGPAHAIAISCGDQGIHHGVLSALGLLAMIGKLEAELPARVRMLSETVGHSGPGAFGAALRDLVGRLGLPLTLAEAGYRIGGIEQLAGSCSDSHFNLTAGYRPGTQEYREMLMAIAA
jgi:alcohol dehydrogenase class IV